MASASYQKLKLLFEEAGQGHVFAFWDTLNESAQSELLEHLNGIDPIRCNRIFKQTTSTPSESGVKAELQPLPKEAFSSVIDLGLDSDQVREKDDVSYPAICYICNIH